MVEEDIKKFRVTLKQEDPSTDIKNVKGMLSLDKNKIIFDPQNHDPDLERTYALNDLKSAICHYLENPIEPKAIKWSGKIAECLPTILDEIAPYSSRIEKRYPINWLALSLLEEDEYAWNILRNIGVPRDEFEDKLKEMISEKFDDEAHQAVTDEV